MGEGSNKVRRRIVTPREVLLVEVERYCGDINCHALTRTGLTKEDARSYAGFKCERCERWNDDDLTERDIPEWWEELKITSLEGVRPAATGEGTGAAEDEPGEVVARMSEAWRLEQGRGGGGPDGDE